jgi:hypothetical protein
MVVWLAMSRLEWAQGRRRRDGAGRWRGPRLLRALLFAGLAAFPATSHAQLRPDGGGSPDLNDVALEWVRGEFRAPLVCEFDGLPRRGLRRLLIAPGPREMQPRANTLRIFDLDAGEATRCFDDLGAEELNVEGVIRFSLLGPSRPDTARRDFSAALRREGGFEFEIREGHLRLERVGDANAEPRRVDFASGVLRVRTVPRGSDIERRLQDLRGQRRLTLSLEAKDGTEVRFHMVQSAPR